MIALGHAAGDVQIQRLVLELVQFNQTAHQPCPFGVVMGIDEPDAVEAGLQSPQMFGEPERMA